MAIKHTGDNPITKADVLMLLVELPNVYWEEFSGLKVDIKRAQFADGQSAQMRPISAGTVEISEIELTKSYDPVNDAKVLTWIEDVRCGKPFNVTVQPVIRCKGIERRGSALSLSGCKITGFEVMSGMAVTSGEDKAQLMIKFFAGDYSFANAVNSPVVA